VLLKKGIDLDICKDIKLNINRTKLRRFLKIYTFNPGYQKLHIVEAPRYDLEGKMVDKVTKEDVESLNKSIALRKKRKAFLSKQK